MKLPPGMKTEEGFTLLELLIALALLAIIAACVYGTYFTVFKGKETVLAGMEERRAIRETLDAVRRELSSAWYRQSDKKTAFIVEDRDQFGKPASRLVFASISPPNSPGALVSDQLTLEYSAVPKGEQLMLTRSARGLHLSGKLPVYPQIDLLDGFLVECTQDGVKWVKSWDTSINSSLPKAVRVTLQIREGSRTVSYSTLATIRMNGV